MDIITPIEYPRNDDDQVYTDILRDTFGVLEPIGETEEVETTRETEVDPEKSDAHIYAKGIIALRDLRYGYDYNPEYLAAFQKRFDPRKNPEELIDRAVNGDRRAFEELDREIEQAQRAPLEPVSSFGTYQERKWIVNGWIPRGAVTILSGPGGVGKSRLALQIATEVATGGGRDILGGGVWRTLRQCDVCYWSWEDDENEIKKRLGQLVEEKHLENLEEHLHIFTLVDHGPLYAPNPRGSGHISTVGQVTPLFDDLAEYALVHNAKLIVIDTAASSFLGDENARALVRQFLDACTSVAQRLDASVLILAHPSKATNGEFSGSTDWTNRTRSAFTMTWRGKRPNRQPVLVGFKQNWTGEQEDIYLVPGEYPYRAGEEIAQEVAPEKVCKGYDGYECDQVVMGRSHRCPKCKRIHNALGKEKPQSTLLAEGGELPPSGGRFP